MFQSLLFAVCFWGTDPGMIFREENPQIEEPKTDSLLSGRLLAASSPTAGGSASSEKEPVIRGQTGPDGYPYLVAESPSCCWWHDPRTQKWLTELNPFAPLDFPVLEHYFDPFGWQMLTGSYGPQPFRLGWTTFNELSFLPASTASGTTGSMQITEWNSNARFSQRIGPGALFDATFWFSAHWWEGPSGLPLPPQVNQVSADLVLGLFDDGPWSAQIGFHPQIVQTYESGLDGNAFNFDGRLIATYTCCNHWKVVLGVAVWDRVNTLIIPSTGLIWTPDDRWEIRALFPASRISYFLGHWKQTDFWVYGQYEYTAEAWQTVLSNPSISERSQITDQRLTAGIRFDSGRHIFYAETGYVFDRQTKFAGSTPGFDLGDAAIITAGFRY